MHTVAPADKQASALQTSGPDLARPAAASESQAASADPRFAAGAGAFGGFFPPPPPVTPPWRSSSSVVYRKCSACDEMHTPGGCCADEETVQRKADGPGTGGVPPSVTGVLSRGGGRPL